MKRVPKTIYAKRRARVQDLLGDGGLLILPAAPEIVIGRSLELRYRPDPDLLYLTGYREPGALLVLGPAGEDEPFTLFVRPRDPEEERWSGARGGPDAAAAEFGATAYPLDEVESRLTGLLARAETIYFPLESGRPEIERLVIHAVAGGRRAGQRMGRGPRTLKNPGSLLDEARLIKEPEEIELIREATSITCEAFLEVIPLIRPGRGEWEIEAALEAAFRKRGADGVGFGTIVARGPNATVLHYRDNDARMEAGQLLLIDAGASAHGYNGDLSRTLPVSGDFTPLQRGAYNEVLAAQRKAISMVRPGRTITEIHQSVCRSLSESLITLGILEGELDKIIEDELYRAYYPHQTSHWLGLDVHDVGDYAVDGRPRALESGMVLTIEPGLYFPADDERVPEELRGVGIRIEDDIVVTEDGAENLTEGLPVAPEELEALITRSQPGTA